MKCEVVELVKTGEWTEALKFEPVQSQKKENYYIVQKERKTKISKLK